LGTWAGTPSSGPDGRIWISRCLRTTRVNERFSLQFRADAFDSLNQVNFTNPGTTIGSSTLGIITGGTRYAAGDFGTSRQMQMSLRLLF
jgi:hypothetical protein